MKIALDIDGVLRDFVGQLTKIYKEDYPDHEVKPVTTWYFHESFPIGKKIYEYYIHNGRLIFRYAPAYDGAREFVQSLKDLGHTVILITTQPRGLEYVTAEWIEKNLPEVDGIIFSKNKFLFDFDVLLDDAPHNVKECVDNGKFAMFYTQKWNEGLPNARVNSYKEFLEYIVDYQQLIKEEIL